MGNMFLAATTSKTSGSSFLPILFIAALFVVLYLVMIRPQRNRQRQAQQMQRTVLPGQRVRTTAGMYGTITSVDDTDVEEGALQIHQVLGVRPTARGSSGVPLRPDWEPAALFPETTPR